MKTLIITGASKGIGHATAKLFLHNDWHVINVSRHDCEIAEVQNFNVDLSEPNWVSLYGQELARAVTQTTRIALVHNAASYTQDNINTIEAEVLRHALEVNVVAATQLNKIFLPLVGAGSSIIYLGSTLSEKAVAGAASYIISKHAVVGMMRATCQDLTSNPAVHTCCVCPGFTETDMVREHLERNPLLAKEARERVSVRRLIQPDEIASLIYYCVESPVINGSVIHANLGQKES